MENKQRDYLHLIRFYRTEIDDIFQDLIECIGKIKVQDFRDNKAKVLNTLGHAFHIADRGIYLIQNQELEINKLVATLQSPQTHAERLGFN